MNTYEKRKIENKVVKRKIIDNKNRSLRVAITTLMTDIDTENIIAGDFVINKEEMSITFRYTTDRAIIFKAVEPEEK